MTPEQKDRVSAALKGVGVDLTDIDDEDLAVLWAAKYRSVNALRASTRASLRLELWMSSWR